MRYQIILNKKNGLVWDIAELVTKVDLTLKRSGSCGVMQISCIKEELLEKQKFEFENGDQIQFYINGEKRFLGYIFKIEEQRKESTVTITVYDQIKYLLYDATYQFVNKKASEIVDQIAREFGLCVGKITDTQFVIPRLIENNKKLIDIIAEALGLTADNGGGQYCLFDDFGYLNLKELKEMKTELILSDTNYIQDLSYNKDIEESYTKFKLIRDNQKSGLVENFEYQNEELIKKWGVLQYLESVDEGLNEAQIAQKLKELNQRKGKEKKTLSIKSVGEFVRAGESIAILIENQKQYFVIDEVKHSFEGGNTHEMELNLYNAD